MALSYSQNRLDSCYRSRQQEKRKCYEEMVREVERGTLRALSSPHQEELMAPASAVVYKRLASLIAERRKQPYHLTINLIRCQFSFCTDWISHLMPERISLCSMTAKITLHDRGHACMFDFECWKLFCMPFACICRAVFFLVLLDLKGKSNMHLDCCTNRPNDSHLLVLIWHFQSRLRNGHSFAMSILMISTGTGVRRLWARVYSRNGNRCSYMSVQRKLYYDTYHTYIHVKGIYLYSWHLTHTSKPHNLH